MVWRAAAKLGRIQKVKGMTLKKKVVDVFSSALEQPGYKCKAKVMILHGG